MKRLLIAGLAAAGLLAAWHRTHAAQQDLDPIKVAADTHTLLFENAFVRVLEVRVPPGKTEPWHSHPRRVVVYLSDFHTRVTTKDGAPEETLRKKGLVRWSEPIVHQVENIGRIEGHVISVELR